MSAHDHDLLAAAFSAMLGIEVLPPHAKDTMDIPSFSIHQLFHGSHIMGLSPFIPDSPSPGGVFEITVSSLDGLQLTLPVKKDETVAQIKEKISRETGILPFQQHLMCAKKELNDSLTLESSGIRPRSRFMLFNCPKAVDNGPPNTGLGASPLLALGESGKATHTIIGTNTEGLSQRKLALDSAVTRQGKLLAPGSPVTRQGKLLAPDSPVTRQLQVMKLKDKPCDDMGKSHKGKCKMNVDDLAPEYDYDYTNMTGGRTYMRGDQPYVRPFGWKRYAVKVLGNTKYKKQDEKNGKTADVWLGPVGDRAESVKGEWPVSYHGTSVEAAESIVSGGDGKPGYKPSEKDKGGRVVHGDGVYSSPSIEYAANHYASPFTKDQNKYLTVLQNRVNPEDGHLIFTTNDKIWVSPMQDSSKGIYDVRPYGILIKKV